jgi:hypothetical protein
MQARAIEAERYAGSKYACLLELVFAYKVAHFRVTSEPLSGWRIVGPRCPNRNELTQLLLATDVIYRGLHFSQISLCKKRIIGF